MGGGFGGKTGFYGEPVAIQLARKAKRPVKITLTRNEVFRATGPVSGTKSRIKMGVTKDGVITAAEAELLPRALCAAGRVRRRRRDRRTGAQDRHGSDRPAPEECRDRRLQDDLRRDLRSDRLCRNAAGRQELRSL